MDELTLLKFDELLKKECEYTSKDINLIGYYQGYYYLRFPNTTEMYKIDDNFKTIEFIDSTVYALHFEADGKSLGQKSKVIYEK